MVKVDKRKFNLNGPDDFFSYYWQSLVSTHPQGSDSGCHLVELGKASYVL